MTFKKPLIFLSSSVSLNIPVSYLFLAWFDLFDREDVKHVLFKWFSRTEHDSGIRLKDNDIGMASHHRGFSPHGANAPQNQTVCYLIWSQLNVNDIWWLLMLATFSINIVTKLTYHSEHVKHVLPRIDADNGVYSMGGMLERLILPTNDYDARWPLIPNHRYNFRWSSGRWRAVEDHWECLSATWK